MKRILIVALTLMISHGNIHANDLAKVASIIGIMVAFSNNNSNKYDDIINYKSYKLGKTYNITASQRLINIKNEVGVKYKRLFIKDIPLLENYDLDIDNNSISESQINKNIKIVSKPIYNMYNQIVDREPLYATFNDKGILVSTDYIPLKKEIGKVFLKSAKLFFSLNDTFSQELIFSGVYQNKLHITYREYIGEMIKSPFTQSLVFDLSLGKTIKIGKFTIEIIKVNNTELLFKVINDNSY